MSTTYRRLLRSVEERPASVLLLLMLFAFAAGMVRLWMEPPSFEFNWENRWWQIAVNVAVGNGYVACKPIYFPFCGPENQITAMREPLPVLLFALIALVTHNSLLAAAVSGVIVNLGIVVAVFLLTRELANTRAGVLAALFWICYLPPIRIFYSQPSGDLLATLALTCGLFQFLRARRTGHQKHWFAAGVWLGLAMLSRSAVVIVAVVLTLGQMFLSRTTSVLPQQSFRRRLRPIFVFAMAWVVTASPWLVRNYLVFGRPVIGSTLSGYYLYRQNHTLPSDNYLRFVTGAEFVPVIHQMIARRKDLQGKEDEAAMDLVYREEALRTIKAEPLRYVALSGFRFLMLWFNWGVKQAYNLPNTIGDHLTVVQHVLLLAGGALGLRRRWRLAWPLAASVVASSLLYMLVMAHLPYAVAVVPLLVALTAIACTEIGSHVRLRLSRSKAAAEPATAPPGGKVGVTLHPTTSLG